MNKRHLFTRLLFCLIVAAALLPSPAGAAEIVLDPGYISGSVNLGAGTGNVTSFSINATGGGYKSSKSVSGKDYSLTVQGGTWNYSVTASAQVRQGTSYYPSTNITFSNRSFSVPVGQTVTNDYNPTGAVRFNLTITGDAYSSWRAYGYASKSASGGNEQTNSNSYTTSSYSPDKTWVMPVVPNTQIRIYSYVYVDSSVYYVWTDVSSYLYKDIAAGEIVDVNITVQHTAPPPPECQVHPENCPPPLYDYGTVQGTVNLDLMEPGAFTRHYVQGASSSYIYTNPGSFTHSNIRVGTYGYRMYSYFDNSRIYYRWPNSTGYKSVPVEKDKTTNVDFNDSTGMLTGKLKITGTAQNSELNSYVLYAYGAGSLYIDNKPVSQPTYYGYSYISKYGSDGSDSYRLFLSGGYWNPYYFSANKSGYVNGYYRAWSLNMYDYNYYYDGGSNYDYGQPAIITPGSTTVQDREICLGSVAIRFRDYSGGTMSNPRVSGSGVHYNSSNKQDLSVSVNASQNITNAEAPEVEVHGPTATYSLTSSATAQDGTSISFPAIGIGLECGVRKCSDRKAPSIAMTSPSPELITNAQSVAVSGTTTDEFGIQAVTVNDNSAQWWLTGNGHEVAFTYDLALEPGMNHIRTFIENIECNSCFDERNVYVDRWVPSVTITAPADGEIYAPNGPTVPVSVSAADQGYGYTLTVYLDGTQIGRSNGAANDTAPATATFDGNIGPLSEGSHTIKAEAVDLAGNRAETTVTIVSNRPPTAHAGPDQTVECASANGTTVVLDGSASSDPDGDALTYTWTWDGGSATGVSPTVTLPFGATSVILTVSDQKGGSSSDTVEISIRDTTPPVTVITNLSGIAGNDGWYRSDVAVTLNSSDACAGVKEIISAVDGQVITTSGSAAVVTIAGDAVHSVDYRATDNAGNAEMEHPVTVMIDATPPLISASVSPEPNANGWHNTDVTVTFVCSDALSGVASCPAPVTVTTEGGSQTISGTAVDNAGNTAGTSVTLNIDKTAPEASLSVTPSMLWPPNHKVVDVAVNGVPNDGTSGIQSVVFTVKDEYGKVQPVVNGFNTTIPLEAWREGTDKDGRHYTITAVITDKAGNATVVTTEAVCPHDMRGKN